MAAHYNFYCPYCNSLMFSKVRPSHEGSVITSCPRCGKQYADPYSIELALTPFHAHTVWELLTSELFTGIGFGFFIALIVYFATQKNCAFLLIWLVFSAICWLLCFLHSLLTRSKADAKRLERWKESEHRLKNTNYAFALKALGYTVPSEYLPPETAQNHSSEPVRFASVEKHGLL